MGTLNLIDAARAASARQFIFASSEWVYDSFEPGIEKTEDDPIDAARLTSEYALSKFVSESNLRQAYQQGSFATTVLRFGIIYGPRRTNWSAVEALFDNVARHDVVKVGSVRTARRFLHVADAAGAILASVGVPRFEIMNVQGPKLVSLGDVVETSARLLGRSIQIVEGQGVAPSIRTVSAAKIQKRTAWSPSYDLGRGLAELAPVLGHSLSSAV
jgi:UDP-glucose 4-epimerase